MYIILNNFWRRFERRIERRIASPWNDRRDQTFVLLSEAEVLDELAFGRD